jgi:NAD(P)-dependent dehydrogenase (short-subunit alcohol dehydrogenase family)
MKFEGKTAFVTGAAGGLGSGVVRACLAQGMKVAVVDFDPARVEAVRDTLGDAKARTIPVLLDVSDYQAWGRAVDEAEAAFGPISLLVNVVGIGSGSMLAEDDPDRLRVVFEVNVFGHWYGCRTLLPRMLSRKTPAHIVNVSSISGLLSHPGSAIYDASKHALVGMTNSLRYELSGSNVGLSLACPGLMNTNFSGNSVAYLSGRSGLQNAPGSQYSEMMKTGMNTDEVGRMIIAAAGRGDYWIFTHPHWKQALDVIEGERDAAFGQPAQAGYTDGLPAASAQRHRHAMSGEPALS